MAVKDIVDLTTLKNLSQEHLAVHQQYNNENQQPEYYGKDFPYGEFRGFRIVELSDVKWHGGKFTTQLARYLGGNPRAKEIRNSIREQGYKLSSPPLFLEEKSDGLYPITGHTRHQILVDMGVKTAIAAVWKMKDESSASLFAVKANPKPDPAGPMTIQDVEMELKRAYQEGWIDKSDDMIEQIGHISERMEELCGNSFTKSAKDAAILRVLQTKDINFNLVHSWITKTQINNWVQTNGYLNTSKVMYFVVAASTVSKALIRASELSAENPGVQIRVICHTSVLDSGNLEYCYNDRVNTFREKWEGWLESIRTQFFKTTDMNKCKVDFTDNIVLYGALPALEEHHDMTKVVRYHKSSRIVLPTYSFDDE